MSAPHERGGLARRSRSPDEQRPPPHVSDHSKRSRDSPKRSAAPGKPAARTASLACRTQAMILQLYRALIRLLPRRVRDRDGEEMARAFADQIAGAREPSAVRRRALLRFPGVLALEWPDAL